MISYHHFSNILNTNYVQSKNTLMHKRCKISLIGKNDMCEIKAPSI